jgi:ankyrin repeat protein
VSPVDQELLSAFDGHDADGVRAALDAGADPCSPIRGKPPVEWLLEEYTRSDRLAVCLRLLLDRGASLRDPAVVPVLLNDGDAVRAAVRADPSLLNHRTTLTSAFTSLVGVSLLHVAAEYGHSEAARALIEAGADVNATAAVDEHGLNGHTPLFHTVNSIRNRSEPILRLLLAAGARPDVRLAGLTWGKGYEWETTFFDVTPISFAQMGLLPQVHRNEREIYANLRLLLAAAGRSVSPLDNVPNRYLQPKSHPERGG